MNNTLVNKGIVLGEAFLIFLTTKWSVVAGVFSALCASLYYLSMLKLNVVDVKYNGSWTKYLTNWAVQMRKMFTKNKR